MRRALVVVMGILLILMAGCGGTPITPVSNVPTVEGSSPTSPPPTTDPSSTEVPNTPDSGVAGCRLAPAFGQPLPDLPPVTEDDWMRGDPDAPVTMILYSDFQ